MPPLHQLGHVFRSGPAVHGQPLLLAPGNERHDFDVHPFDFLPLALDHSNSFKSTPFPLFVSVVELVSIFNRFRQAPPLRSVKPREANNRCAIGRVLRHVVSLARFVYGLAFGAQAVVESLRAERLIRSRPREPVGNRALVLH